MPPSGLGRLLSPGLWPWRFVVAVFAPRLAMLALTRLLPLPGDELQRLALERLLSAAVGFLVLLAVVRLMEGSTLRQTGLFERAGWLRRLSLGLGLGAGPVALQAAAVAAAGLYAFSWPGRAGPAQAAALSAVLAVVAVDEEIRYRALAFRTLDQGAGSWLAMACSAAFFGLSHAGNRGATPLGVTVIAAGGVFLAACYLRYRSLWAPIGFHFAWNTTMGVVLGLPISGARVPGLLGAASTGPEIWTGGGFGPESSAATAALVTALAAFFVWRVAAEGRIRAPAWRRRRRLEG
ncbi:MAG TPA: CPBP family intramembrane glutamic endopeptidase, partial [Anaeromyxobacteraceae bacterium]|nr:CPBP family intramembrane glutamic endopeptidase [Anaeromyxobacteraceae bacterium]